MYKDVLSPVFFCFHAMPILHVLQNSELFISQNKFSQEKYQSRLSTMSRSFSNCSDDTDRDGWFFYAMMFGNKIITWLVNYFILLHATEVFIRVSMYLVLHNL
jgi:hypothetical protein